MGLSKPLIIVLAAVQLYSGVAQNATTTTVTATTTTYTDTATTVTATLTSVTATTTTPMMGMSGNNATNATTATTTTVTTTTITTTAGEDGTGTPEAREIVQGTMDLTVDDVDAFINDAGAKLGIRKAISSSAGVDLSYVDVTLTAISTRRLQRARRLSGGNVKVDYTITIPVTAASTVTASSVASTLSSVSTADLATLISTEVGNESTNTYAPISISARPAPALLAPGETTTPSPTTTPASSLTRTQAAFTATNVAAVLVGMMFMQ